MVRAAERSCGKMLGRLKLSKLLTAKVAKKSREGREENRAGATVERGQDRL